MISLLESTNLNSFYPSCIRFGKPNRENTVLERGFRFVSDDIDRQQNRTRKRAPVTFLVVVVIFGNHFFVLALSFDCHHVVIDSDIEILGLDAGNR